MRKRNIAKAHYSREAWNRIRERLGLSTLEELAKTGNQLPKRGKALNSAEEADYRKAGNH